MTPLVTVLMPAFNAENYIAEAIESILNQSFNNFEFIIVDDGSTDSTKDIIASYGAKDKRIRVLSNQTNKGLIYSLNKGLDAAKGKFIARMDADDVSLSNRLDVQVSFMESNQEIGASSAWMKTLETSKEAIWQTPLEHGEIMAKMFCNTCLWHPVAMIRKDTLDTYNLCYDAKHPKAEDYKLWLDIAKYKRLANIPKVLHRYRIHDQQKTKTDFQLKKRTVEHLEYRRTLPGIREKLLMDFLGREITLEEVKIHANLFFEIPFIGEKELKDVQNWVEYLISVNQKEKKYAEPYFSRNLKQKIAKTKTKSFKYFCKTQKRYHPKLLWKLMFSECNYYSGFSTFELTLFVFNSFTLRKVKFFS